MESLFALKSVTIDVNETYSNGCKSSFFVNISTVEIFRKSRNHFW